MASRLMLLWCCVVQRKTSPGRSVVVAGRLLHYVRFTLPRNPYERRPACHRYFARTKPECRRYGCLSSENEGSELHEAAVGQSGLLEPSRKLHLPVRIQASKWVNIQLGF